MRYRLDGSARRVDGGATLIGGSPLTVVRLTPAGRAAVDRVSIGDDLPSSRSLTRLVDLGILHPMPHAGEGPWSAADVTIVIPARDANVDRLVASLAGSVTRVIVVDDASSVQLRVASPAEVVRLGRNGGPGAARNVGLGMVSTALVAFVDADVTLLDGWLDPLLAQFVDERVALVAPRVRSQDGRSRLARYERHRSPLDLGDEPARVAAGTRVAYVPAAAVLARVDAVRQIGGFDDGLRTGEDVDLVWRLVEAGWQVRYESSASVEHEARPDLRRFVAQRVGYGRSAGPLAVRHPGALAPVRVSGWSAAVWGLVVTGHPMAGASVAAATTAALTRKLSQLEHRGIEALRLAGLGHLFAVRQLASAVTRVWWPIALFGSMRSRRLRRISLIAALVPPAWDWWRQRPQIDPVSYTALRIVDDAAYGTGVWRGAMAARTAEPIRPDLTSWPRRSRYERLSRLRPSGR